MRAELKRLYSPDVDLRSYRPVQENNFSILVQAMIGYKGGAGEESFDFIVCTPEWLRDRCLQAGGPIFGKSHIIVDAFEYSQVELALENLCASIEGRDWDELASKLGRYGDWEFSDYKFVSGG